MSNRHLGQEHLILNDKTLRWHKFELSLPNWYIFYDLTFWDNTQCLRLFVSPSTLQLILSSISTLQKTFKIVYSNHIVVTKPLVYGCTIGNPRMCSLQNVYVTTQGSSDCFVFQDGTTQGEILIPFRFTHSKLFFVMCSYLVFTHFYFDI